MRLFILLNLIFLLTYCSTAQKAFTNQKKNSTDEFLVEKKSPLVMPPNYNELPLPTEQNNKTGVEENNIENLFKNNKNENNSSDSSQNESGNFEESLLEKIKKN
tara:strand:- start:1117 stop:1428 length:312 start_codon:yes stop_codon:yes gene_type:complete